MRRSAAVYARFVAARRSSGARAEKFGREVQLLVDDGEVVLVVQEAAVGIDLGVHADPELHIALELRRARHRIVRRQHTRRHEHKRAIEQTQRESRAGRRHPMSSSFTPRLIANSTVHSMICARARLYGGTASSANVSMILTATVPAPAHRPSGDPAAPAATGRKASHNGHCVTLEPRPRYNMSHRRGCRGRLARALLI